MQNADFPYAVLTHGGRVDELKKLTKKNREASEAVMKLILEITKELQSREEIASILIRKHSLPLSTTQYYFIHTTTSAFLSYLNSNNRIRLRLLDGVVKFVSVQEKMAVVNIILFSPYPACPVHSVLGRDLFSNKYYRNVLETPRQGGSCKL
jgi:hypothetical protein